MSKLISSFNNSSYKKQNSHLQNTLQHHPCRLAEICAGSVEQYGTSHYSSLYVSYSTSWEYLVTSQLTSDHS